MNNRGPDAVAWAAHNKHRIPEDVNGSARIVVTALLMDAFEAGQARSGEPHRSPQAEATHVQNILPLYEVTDRAYIEADLGPLDEDGWGELRGWWEQTAHDEIAGLVAKAQEYGGITRATDLIAIGEDLIAAGVKEPLHMGDAHETQNQWATELGIYFYLRGKFARWQAAVIDGRPVSDDTLHDIAIYTRMAQRNRTVGGWPV